MTEDDLHKFLLDRLRQQGIEPVDLPLFLRDLAEILNMKPESDVGALNARLNVLGWHQFQQDYQSLHLVLTWGEPRRGIPRLKKFHHPEAFPCYGNSDRIFEGYLSRSNGNLAYASCDILGRYTQLRTFLNRLHIPDRYRAWPLRLETNHLIPSNSFSNLETFDFYQAS